MVAKMTLDFYQILYKEEQRAQLYDFAKPVFSIGLTPYFENQFIATLVPQSNADYISVCSWRLRQKRGDITYALGGHGRDALSVEKIEGAMPFDVAILTPRSANHQALNMVAHWHGKAWVDAFNAFKPFLSKFGKVPEELKWPIYENHFIARKEIYHDYVKSYLLPAVEYCGDDLVYFVDSLYTPKKKNSAEIQRVQKLLKANDWPILPFLLERLFSFYINDKNLNVIKL